MGRCFGHSLVQGIESLSDCAVIGSTLCRLAPLINKNLTEPAKGDQPEKSLRWRCTLEVTHLVPRPLDQNLQFFEFPDISAFEDSTLIEDDLDAVPLTKEQDEEMSSLMMVSVKEAKAPVSSVEERLAKLEEQLASEQRARALLESKVVALEHRVAQLQDDVLHLTPQPKSPTSQSLVQIAIGRQRGKSGSGAASDADTPELPPRQPRLTVAGRTTGGNK